MFEPSQMLKRPKGPWTTWQPRQRIEPGEPLQYKNPVIREYTVREDEEKCDLPISNQAEI